MKSYSTMCSVLTLASFASCFIHIAYPSSLSFFKLISCIIRMYIYEISCSVKLIVSYNLFYLCISYYLDIYNIFCYYKYHIVNIVMSNFHSLFL